MVFNTLQRNVWITLFVLCSLVLPAFADVWNYPEPDPNRDVNDISFYQAPENSGVLKNIGGQKPRNVIFLIGDGMGVNQVALRGIRQSVRMDGCIWNGCLLRG
jgi:hypothetical protein